MHGYEGFARIKLIKPRSAGPRLRRCCVAKADQAPRSLKGVATAKGAREAAFTEWANGCMSCLVLCFLRGRVKGLSRL